VRLIRATRETAIGNQVVEAMTTNETYFSAIRPL